VNSKFRVVAIVSIACLLTAVATWALQTTIFEPRHLGDQIVRYHIVETSRRVQRNVLYLQLLRSGRSDEAVSLMDRGLDVDVMDIATYARFVPSEARVPSIYGAVKVARQYRNDHPTTLTIPEERQILESGLNLNPGESHQTGVP
jgi:hypothetical protein